MNGLLRAGGVALVAFALVFVGRSTSEPKKAPAPRSRIALINLSTVIRGYQKYKDFQARTKEEIEDYQKKDKEMRAQLEPLGKELLDTELPDQKRREVEDKIKQLKRALEDNQSEAKAVLGKKSDEQMVILYKEVQQAVARYAKANDLELVLHFNDADAKTQAAEFWSPANVARKMQAGACMPMYAAPGLDISEEIIEALNKGLGRF
jgi:Skp family chaperone for outer membrane proteins